MIIDEVLELLLLFIKIIAILIAVNEINTQILNLIEMLEETKDVDNESKQATDSEPTKHQQNICIKQ